MMGPALVAAAAPLSVSVESMHAGCRNGVIVVTPASEHELTVPFRIEEGERTVVTLESPDADRWTVRMQAERCWAPVVSMGAADQGDITMRVWRSAVVSGRLKFPDEKKSRRSVAVRIESDVVPATELQCPVEGNRFHCTVPATALDLRIAPEDWAPQYLWNIQPRADAAVDVGEVKFDRGGTITGFVRIAGGGPELRNVAIDVVPALTPSTRGFQEAEHRIRARGQSARPNARGFFEFRQLETGPYTITARAEGWSQARDPDVRVEAGRETRLSDPLVIEPLTRVEVFLLPPLDPDGQPWRVSLQHLMTLAGDRVTVAEGDASLTGQWFVDGVNTGVHFVEVSDHRGNGFARSTIEVSPRMPPVQVTIDAIAIHGTVRMGSNPLQTRLDFRNKDGQLIEFRSDEEGRYSGTLPTEGRWDVRVDSAFEQQVMIRNIDVRRRDGGTARVDLELPGTSIDGTVVSESGDLVHAQVRALDANGRIITTARTDEQGHIRLLGLDSEHPLRLTARSGELSSSAVPVTFDDDGHAEVTIVMRSVIKVRAWLVTPAGRPVAGAFIRWTAAPENVYRELVSGPSGEFEVVLPPDAGSLELILLPPAMPVKLLSIPVRPGMDPKVEIVVGGPSGTLELTMSHLPPFPFIRREGQGMPAMMLVYPPNWMTAPRELRPWGLVLTLEAGSYTVCSNTGANCKSVSLPPGAVERIDGRELVQ